MLAPRLVFVNDLEEMCINEPDLQFNVPNNMEKSKVRFEHKPTFTKKEAGAPERRS